MPSKSGAQQRLMAAAYARKKAGHPRAGDPKMSLSSLHDFMHKEKGAPDRVQPKSGYGKGPVG